MKRWLIFVIAVVLIAAAIGLVIWLTKRKGAVPPSLALDTRQLRSAAAHLSATEAALNECQDSFESLNNEIALLEGKESIMSTQLDNINQGYATFLQSIVPILESLSPYAQDIGSASYILSRLLTYVDFQALDVTQKTEYVNFMATLLDQLQGEINALAGQIAQQLAECTSTYNQTLSIRDQLLVSTADFDRYDNLHGAMINLNDSATSLGQSRRNM